MSFPIAAPALAPGELGDLHQVLRLLVARSREALGGNLVGAYLVGSFALGAADIHSDVDFLVVTADPVDAGQEAALRVVHQDLPDLPFGWAQHLEGSYVPAGELDLATSTGGQWWYVDNGSRVLERSDHDNSAVTRWVLRERGIILHGPLPKRLLGPVSARRLREGARDSAQAWRDALARDPSTVANAWAQTHAVVSLCRLLYTSEHGVVVSKLAAAEWARVRGSPVWAALIAEAVASRPDPWLRVHRSSSPALARQTIAFADHVASVIEARFLSE